MQLVLCLSVFSFFIFIGKWKVCLGHRIAWKIGILDSSVALLLCVGPPIWLRKPAVRERGQVWQSVAEPTETWQKRKASVLTCGSVLLWRGEDPRSGDWQDISLCYGAWSNHASTPKFAVLLEVQLFFYWMVRRARFITFYRHRLVGSRTILFLHNINLRKNRKDKEVVIVKWASVTMYMVHFPWNTTAAVCRFWSSGDAWSSQLDHVAWPLCQQVEFFLKLASYPFLAWQFGSLHGCMCYQHVQFIVFFFSPLCFVKKFRRESFQTVCESLLRDILTLMLFPTFKLHDHAAENTKSKQQI